MTVVLEKIGLTFLRAFGIAFLFLAPGILNAPDENAAIGLSVAALAASISAGLKAAQELIPQLSFKGLLGDVWGSRADIFVQAFVGVFLTFWQGWLAAPDWATWKSALLAAVIAAATAGARALQGLFTKGEFPAPSKGLKIAR